MILQVVTLDGRTLLDIPAGASLHSVAPTPGQYNAMAEDGFSSTSCHIKIGSIYFSLSVNKLCLLPSWPTWYYTASRIFFLCLVDSLLQFCSNDFLHLFKCSLRAETHLGPDETRLKTKCSKQALKSLYKYAGLVVYGIKDGNRLK